MFCSLVCRYHDGDAYIIDVSQSVEHDHPHALEFLRKDCSNVNGGWDFTATQVTPPSLNLTHTEAPPPPFIMETYRQRRHTFFTKACMHRSQEATPPSPRCTEALSRESTRPKANIFLIKALNKTLYIQRHARVLRQHVAVVSEISPTHRMLLF